MEEEGEMKMLLDMDRRLPAATGYPEGPETDGRESRLNLVVIFTSLDATVAALKKAGALAESLGARITLVVIQLVPYPLPLTSPPVLLDFQEKRFRDIATAIPVEIRVQLYLCRDVFETLDKVVQPHSLVVIGGRKRWWPTREKRLARKLQSAHQVIFTEAD
jgi:hypothetical protein